MKKTNKNHHSQRTPKNKGLARYVCGRCGFKYVGLPGPTQCQKCSHLYIKWENFKLWIEVHQTLIEGE